MKIAFEGKIEGKKIAGRPTMMLLDWIGCLIRRTSGKLEISKCEGAGTR